ncbi:hypothetical protein FCV25MIE_33640 [Fagus crenata]
MAAGRDESKTTRGEHKSYVEAVGGIKHEMTVTAKPVIRAPEMRKEAVTGNQGFQDPPKIVAQSKQCEPLRFFPYLAPVAENRFVKGGLTICWNKQGQRKVNWTPKEDNVKQKWVPCGPGPGLGKNTRENEAVLDSRAQSTFEVGKSSKNIREEAQVNSAATKPTETNSERGIRIDPSNSIDPRLITQPDKPKSSVLADISQGETLERTEKVRKDHQAAMSTWIDWSLIFKDGQRVVIPDFSASPWDSAWVLPHLNSEVLVMPIVGVLTHGSSSEDVRGNSLARDLGGGVRKYG